MSHHDLNHRILLCGVSSITGYALLRGYGGRFRAFRSPYSRHAGLRNLPEFRLETPTLVQRTLGANITGTVLYTHAVCDVPKCEENPAWAREVNVAQMTRLMDQLSPRCRFVYLSSDHVFSEDGAYTEGDPVSPLSTYGRTRVEAERVVLSRENTLVIRAGLPLGPSPDGRTGHIDWLRHRSRSGLPITLVRDESRSVVWSEELAERILLLAQSTATGIRHVAAEVFVARPLLARYLLKSMGLEAEVRISCRKEQPAPHIGRVELKTCHRDDLARPLPGIFHRPLRGIRPSNALCRT